MTNYHLSQNGVNLIKKFEGVRLVSYKAVPTEKYYTIGYGHYGSDVHAGQHITLQQAEEMLKKDLKKYENGVNDVLKVPVTQGQFDSMVSLCYNIGVGGFQKSTLIRLVNQKNFSGAALEFLKWNKSSGKVLVGLTNRRNLEKNLFLNGGSIADDSVKKKTVHPSLVKK